MTRITFTATPHHLSLDTDHPEKIAAQVAVHQWLKATQATAFTHLPDSFGFSVEVSDETPRPTPNPRIGRHYRVAVEKGAD